MYGILINDIELLSNKKSFQIQIDTTRNLWILLHLKELTIIKSNIYHQREKFYRKEPYPIRKLRGEFKHTPELLAHINQKSWRYNSELRKFSLDFSNGWNVNISHFHLNLEFNTNSTEQRDDLINKLLELSGIEPIDCDRLTPNIGYMISLDNKHHLTTLCDIPHPDQFWTEDQVETWKKWYLENEENESLPF